MHRATKHLLVEDNNMLQTLTANGTNTALHMSSLPRRSRSSENLFDVHDRHLAAESGAINAIPISQQIFRCGIKWKSLDDLLRGPLCSRMSCDIEMDNASAFMSQHHQDEQNLKPNRVYREEVDRNEL